MDWKAINLHVENLIPGIILLAEIRRFWDWEKFAPTEISSGGIIEALIFLSVSYGIGVLLAVVSRFVIDSFSEMGPRALVITRLSHRDVQSLITLLEKEDPLFEPDFKNERKRRLRIKIAKLWNPVYRGVLRKALGNKEKAESVNRRREQGRLVRNMIIPLVLAVAQITNPGWQGTLITVGSAVLGIFLYAYAELNNFAEALDIAFPASWLYNVDSVESTIQDR